jgi:hypothetical protein
MVSRVPHTVHGSEVIEFTELPQKLMPRGYVAPADGREPLQPTDLVVIAHGEGVDGGYVYWVRCLDDKGQVVAGDMYYTLESARDFLRVEYGVESAKWSKV